MITRKEVIDELERLAESRNYARKQSKEALWRAIDMLENCECGDAD